MTVAGSARGIYRIELRMRNTVHNQDVEDSEIYQFAFLAHPCNYEDCKENESLI